MNQRRLDTIVQAVVGIVALIALVFLVSRGNIEGVAVIPVVAAILAAFGFAEVGRRQGRKP